MGTLVCGRTKAPTSMPSKPQFRRLKPMLSGPHRPDMQDAALFRVPPVGDSSSSSQIQAKSDANTRIHYLMY